MKTLSKTGYLAYFGDLKIDLKKEVKKDLKMEPLKCAKFTYLGGGGSPQRGYPGGGHLRSFWGRFGGRFEVPFGAPKRRFWKPFWSSK